MHLAEFEQKIVEKLYNTILSDDEDKGITLYGNTGSGKSTIALSLANCLLEGWSIFFIEGLDPSLSPYLTWHIGTKLYSKRKLNIGSDISFGVNFFPSPISIEFGASLSSSVTNYILTPVEEAIVTSIKRQAEAYNNILIIADNFELWDIPSKQLLQKIMHPQLKVLNDYHLTTIIIGKSRNDIDIPTPWHYFEVPNISDDSLLQILRENGYSETICITDIRACAGNDLSLAFMAADYYEQNGKSAKGFAEIMDRRCAGLSEEKQEIRKVLCSLSIIESCFSKEEAAFFLDPLQSHRYEIEYQAEEYLQEAEEQLFIKGEHEYMFITDKVKEYFNAKLEKKERFYHRQFSEFLQCNHPEDYYSRGKHLSLSVQLSDTKQLVEAWQLLLLAYFRRSTNTGNTNDIYNIIEEIEHLIKGIPGDTMEAQHQVLFEFTRGFQDFIKYNYRNALLHFLSIPFSRLIPACLAECQRLILLCNIQLADNLGLIVQSANELYNTIEENDFDEDEQYCRAALVLLDAYIDRSNDQKKVNILKNKIIRIIQNHMGIAEFDEFEACYNRKAALYYPALIAYRQTEQSIHFYKKHCNRNGTYMALCNHSGNAIISGEYTAANTSINECAAMINDCSNWYYPSQYKVENNRILLDYLLEEKNANGNRRKVLSAAKKAMDLFYKLLDHQYDEVSHVVLFNYIGLSMLCQTSEWEFALSDANRLLSSLDEYYQYFLYDLNFANALLKENTSKAKKYLDILKTLDAPLLRQYRVIFQKRQLVQEDLLYKRKCFSKNPFEYHCIISKECNRVQDVSCYFWGRGFLLSDLQFLSF